MRSRSEGLEEAPSAVVSLSDWAGSPANGPLPDNKYEDTAATSTTTAMTAGQYWLFLFPPGLPLGRFPFFPIR